MKKTISLPLIILAFGLLTMSALAASSSWNGTVGGVSVTAQKSIAPSGSLWVTDLSSSAQSNINIIGFTYWSLGEYCVTEGRWAYWNQYSGDFNTNDDWYWTTAYVLYRGCNGTSQLRSYGNHDFANGAQHIYPYVYVSENH